MIVPQYVTHVTDILKANGYDAYLAGGCVRDMLMDKEPHDYDIATDALPDRVMEIFSDHRVILTGAAHGTVAVVSDGNNVEITTYRADGVYSDKRRPDTVSFSVTAEEDMSRRDLTINAMMMDPDSGEVIDIFGGREDLSRGIIRCVGDPVKRFGEDALRIMRALRFASVLGFDIESGTDAAIRAGREDLREIAVERIAVELIKLLTGKTPARILCAYPDVLSVVIPEIIPCVGFDQNSIYHNMDVWTHTAYAVERSVCTGRVRLALLLHDIEKPSHYSEENGSGHFHGHDTAGAETAERIMQRLKLDKKTIRDVSALVRYHEIAPGKEGAVKKYRKLYGMLGRELFCDLFEVATGDNMAKSEYAHTRLERLAPLRDEILAYADGGGCTDIRSLAVNGSDLAAAGLDGEEIGRGLERALDMVTGGEIANEKQAILSALKG